MNDVLKNIKTLFFTYMSIILVLFFAVLQSSNEKYDSALKQLKEIETIVSVYDQKEIQSLINKKIDTNKIIKTKYSIPNLNITINFIYKQQEMDYASLKGKFEAVPPMGYDFGIGNQEKFPDDFTKMKSVKTYIINLLPARALLQYIKTHNNTLEDIIIPAISPDFSQSRIEVFEYKKTKSNSIEMINISEFVNNKIFDRLNLESEGKYKTGLSCNLKLVKTKINSKYAYYCSSLGFSYRGVEYSGARIFIPAKYNSVTLKKNELMNLYKIPEDKRIEFESAYEELFDLTSAYSFLDFSKIKTILASEKKRNPSKLSVFGAEINIGILTKLIFPLLIIICLYLFLHLNEARKRLENVKDNSSLEVPWIGIYSDKINQYVIFLQLIIFPLMLMALIHIKSNYEIELILSWFFLGLLLVINYCNYNVVVRLRNDLKYE